MSISPYVRSSIKSCTIKDASLAYWALFGIDQPEEPEKSDQKPYKNIIFKAEVGKAREIATNKITTIFLIFLESEP